MVYDRRMLGRLKKAMKDAPKPLKKELYKALNRAAWNLRKEARQEARDRLPSRGGLAGRVAKSRISVRRRFGSRSPRITIAATGNPVEQVRQIDRGFVRHPVWGDRETWVTQKVSPGWWTDPMEKSGPGVRKGMQEAIRNFINKVSTSAKGP